MLNSTASPLSGLSALSGPPYFVDLHVNPGESVSIQLFDGNETILRGPATITMISQHTFPPIPMPVQVPPGHMIQQIVDENGQLRHIILSAHPNNGNTSPSNTALIPQQHQPQQPFPYCCCCCYSCTGSAPSAPLPPPLPPPPPPQLHHNILAFPTPPNRRRLNPMNRTFSPVGKRTAPTYLNNNSIGKSPIRSKLVSTPTSSVDGVSKVSFANKHSTPSEGKPYELNGNRVLVGRVNQNDNNCLSDSKHVLNKTFINNEAINRAINSKEFMPNNGSILSAPRPVPPFSYTSLEEHKDLNHSFDRTTNCSHFESSEKPSILLEINLSSSDSRPQNNISNDIVEEVDEEEEEEELMEESEQSSDDCKHQNQIEIENILINSRIEDKEVETSRAVEQVLSHSHEAHEESLCAQLEDKSREDLTEEQNETIGRNSNNYRNTRSDSHSTNSCISALMQDNQNEDKTNTEPNHKSNGDPSLSQSEPQSNQHPMDTSDSINPIERQSDKPVDYGFEETDYSIESSDENQTKDSIINKKVSEDATEEVAKQVSVPVLPPMQRSPKHLLPQLQLLNLTYTSLTANTVKLKWTHSEPHSTAEHLYAKHYVVEMWQNKWQTSASGTDSTSQSQSQTSQNCRVVYQGHSNNCRISHLQSQQQYSFRVRTTSEEHLVVSNALTITTPEQQPISNKLNKKSRREVLQQQIQQQQHQIHQQQLLLQQQQLQQSSQSRTDSTEPAISSDQRCAILLLLLFTVFAMIVAVLFQQLLSD